MHLRARFGRCAERHFTAECRQREDPKNFTCAICHGPHRAWDNVCNIRQDELDSIRLARANRPEYHPKPSCNLGELSKHTDDVLSRDFAGTRRYSVEYLIEIDMRGGRKSHAKLRGRGGRGQGLPPDFRESPESIEQESVPFPRKPTANSRGRNGKAPFGSDRYGVQVAAWAGCLKIKPEVQSDWGGDGSMQGQNFGWGQGGVITMHPDQSRKASGGPRRPFTSGSPNQPLRPGAVNWERRQSADSK